MCPWRAEVKRAVSISTAIPQTTTLATGVFPESAATTGTGARAPRQSECGNQQTAFFHRYSVIIFDPILVLVR